MRVSYTRLVVLRAILDVPDEERYGYHIMQATKASRSPTYRILRDLERRGWVESELEPSKNRRLGRPPRRYYTVTALGLEQIDVLHDHLASFLEPRYVAAPADRHAA